MQPCRFYAPRFLLTFVLTGACLSGIARGENIQTRETHLIIEARDQELIVRSLAADAGDVEWIEGALAATPAGSLRLIDHVVRDGQTVPVRWRLTDAAETSDRAGKSLAYSFISEDSQLELRS